MNTAINLLPVIPVRKEPSHKSEMVSQLLFGEYVEVMEENRDFLKISCLYDGYEGWVQANQLTVAEEVFTTDTYIGCWAQKVLINGECIHVPICSPVYASKEQALHFGKTEIRYLSQDEKCYWKTGEAGLTQVNLETIYKKFLGSPYLWGGKSVFGIDCSGFVQQVFKMFGVKLLRDAFLQEKQGSLVETINQTKLGDLAFFQNEKGRVIHVGIILENNRIIHASGKVRIDTIDEKGIVNIETGKRTHQLHSMRRYS